MPVASTNGANFADVDQFRAAKKAAKSGFTRDDFLAGSVVSADDPPAPEPLDSEIAAMATIAATMKRLNPAARLRVMNWVVDRYRELGRHAKSEPPKGAG